MERASDGAATSGATEAKQISPWQAVRARSIGAASALALILLTRSQLDAVFVPAGIFFADLVIIWLNRRRIDRLRTLVSWKWAVATYLAFTWWPATHWKACPLPSRRH